MNYKSRYNPGNDPRSVTSIHVGIAPLTVMHSRFLPPILLLCVFGLLLATQGVTQAAPTIQYDPDAAYNYAYKYNNKVVSDGYFWTWPNESPKLGANTPVPTGSGIDWDVGDDCAHFVSCVIGAEPNEKGGGLPLPTGTPYGFANVNDFGNWIIAPNNKYGTVVDSSNGSIPDGFVKGDIVLFDWKCDTAPVKYDHIAFYLGNSQFAEHSGFDSTGIKTWSQYRAHDSTACYKFVHISSGTTSSTSSDAAKTNSLTTQCNEQDRNEQYWIYAKFYSPYITALVNILQQQQNENYEEAMFRDHLLDLAQGPFLIKDTIGVKSAKEAFQVFLGTAGLFSDNVILTQFLDTVNKGISAATNTNPASLAASFTVDTAKLLSHALTLFEVNGIVKQMTQWVNVQNALYSLYKTCGDAQTLANSLSAPESAKFWEIVAGVNSMHHSLLSNSNPRSGPVVQGNLFQAPAPLAPLVGSQTSITPKFEWSQVPGANKSWLMVAANEADLPKDTAAIGCSNCIITGSTTETWYTPPEPFSNIGRPNILKPNTRYYWQVMAFDDSSAASAGYYSTPQAFTTVDPGNDRTAPASPVNLTVAPADWSSSNLFVLDWTDPADVSGISKVWWKIGSSPTSSTDGTSLTLPAHKPLEIAVPNEGTTNVYVWLEDGSGNADFRNAAHATLKYDATSPAISITNKTSLSIQSSPVVLSGAISDAGSGTKYMLWSDGRGNGGKITPSGSSWASPAIDLEPGQTDLTVWAIDAAGNFNTKIITVNSAGTSGNNPTGLNVAGLPNQVYSGNSYPLTATATDANGYPLTYVFTRTAGELSGQDNGAITWKAPEVSSATSVNIDVTVNNGQGGAAAATARTTVYPYDSNSTTDISGPSIGFSSPADGASVVVNQAIVVEYSASDASGLVQCAVHFSANGASGPFNVLTFAKDCAGSYSWIPTETTANGVLRIYAMDTNSHSSVVDHRISVVSTPPPDSGTEPLTKPDVYQSREDTVSGAFTLVWSRVPGAASFQIQETFNGSTQYYSTAASSMPFTKAVNGIYYYKVKAVNGPRESDWGGPLAIAVNITPNKPPTMPTNPAPFMNRSGVPFENLVLQWYSIDPDDAMGPRFHIALGPSPSSLMTARDYNSDHARDTTFANSGTLEPDTAYCWQVTAKDSKGDVVAGPIWQFRTAAALSFASPVFTDETVARLPAYLNESISVSVVDVDSDGLQDLAQVNGLPINGKPVVTVYRKDGSGRFVLQALTGIPGDKTPFGGAWADIDGDDDPDLAIWYLDDKPRLFRNEGGFGFTEITASAGLVFSAIPTWTQNTCAWGDADGDGAMDLYCSWEQRLFHNNGNGTFTDVSQGSGISENGRHPWAAIWTDINEDGHPDLITVGPGHGTYINNGHGVFTLKDQPDYISEADRGIAAGDYDNDGHIDLYVVSDYVGAYPNGTPMYPPDRLFKGNGDGTFQNVTANSGLPADLWSHFAATWVDYDNDGWLDLVAGSRLFRNMGDSTFQDVTGAVGIALHDSVFGAVALDANGDGAQDLYFGTQNQDQLFMNQTPTRHWLNVRLLGNASNKSGYYARVETRSGDKRWTRVVTTSTGMGDQESAIQHIGVGSASKVDLQVRWPSGIVDELYDVPVNQTLSVSEGAHVDATPPAAIANLTGVSGSATTIDLSWSAPGDDGTLRTASRYELRWLNEPVTEENWAAANSVPDLPVPAVAGSRQSTRVSGLQPNKTYYFAFKTLDEAGNESAISNSPGVKTQLGQQILNFTATEFGPDRIDLHWKVPEVMIAKYEIRYSTSWLTEGNFSSGTLVDNPPEPGYPGDEQSARLTGLMADTTYYAAVRMIAPDGSGLPLSPVAAAQTAPLSSRFLNTLSSDLFPYSISVSYAPIAAGDVNGDGRTDLIATNYDGGTGKTTVRVNFGESGAPIGASTCTVNLPGSPSSDQGLAVGDLDGDGKDDVVIGARNDSTGGNMAGAVYIYSGGSTLSSTPSKTITGTTGQRLGRSFLTADLNRDGVNDLVVADIGKIYIYFGTVGTFDTTPDMELDLPTEGNAFSSRLWMGVGDINGDGLLDLVAVAPVADATLAIFSSKVSGGFSTTPATLPLGVPYSIGFSSLVIADFTDDGIDDIAIGVGSGSPQTVRIYPGRTGQDWSQATPMLELNGVLNGTMGLAAADINGDHVKDLLVGDSSAGGHAGIVRVYLGGGDLDAIPDKYVEVSNQNNSGSYLLSVGDINGDGYEDFFVGGSFSNYDPGVILAGEPLNSATDDVPPAGVTDLAATSDGVGRVVLTWTAPGDDGDKGQASVYGVLQTVANTFSTTWGENAKVLHDIPFPKAAGNVERLVIPGLIPGQTYNFELRAEDDVGNISPPSNMASVTVRQGYQFTERFSFADANPPTCFGYSTSLRWAASAGDVNGDGIDDLLLFGGAGCGRVRVFLGSQFYDVNPDFDVAGDATTGTDLNGVQGYVNILEGGYPLADVNGDGKSDFYTSHQRFYNEAFYAGTANISNALPQGKIEEMETNAGWKVIEPAGDVNGDGMDDFVVMRTLRTQIAGTNTYQTTVTVNLYLGNSTFPSTSSGVLSTDPNVAKVRGIGDFNGDGYADIALAIPLVDGSGHLNGEVQIFFGGSLINPTPGLILHATGLEKETAYDGGYARSIEGIGDFNGDGYTDLAVSAPQTRTSTYQQGKVDIYFGGPDISGDPDIVLVGPEGGTFFGRDLLSAGDLNGDGYADFMVGGFSEATPDQRWEYFIYFGEKTPSTIAGLVFRTNDPSLPDDFLSPFFSTDSVHNQGVDFNRDGKSELIWIGQRLSSNGTLHLVELVPLDTDGDGIPDTIDPYFDNAPPSAPTLSTPADAATGVPLDGTLSWASNDQDGDTLTYDLYFGVADTPPLLVQWLSNASYSLQEISSLAPNTRYYWKVVASDGSGQTAESLVISFVTGAPPVPGAPSGLTVSSSSTGNLLEWTDAGGDHVQYTIVERRLSGDLTWNVIAVADGGESHYFDNFELAGHQSYDYRLRSSNASGDGPYAATVPVVSFNNPPTLSLPESVAFEAGEANTVAVAASDEDADAVGYRLVSGPPGLVMDAGTGNLSWSPSASQIGRYTANIEADDGYGGITNSQMQIMAVDTTPPAISAFNITPSEGTIGQSFSISYTVSDIGGTGLKRIELRRTTGGGASSDPNWITINTASLSGNGPVNGSFEDWPPTPGNYWYEVYVIDNAVPPNGATGGFAGVGPLMVTVAPPPVNGVCGTAAGMSLTAAPTENLCTSTDSTPTIVGNGPWSWSCTGANGGATANCTADLHLKGDLNHDYVVNLMDAILAFRALTGMEAVDIRPDYAASGVDVNGDGKIGLAEAIFILQNIAGMR